MPSEAYFRCFTAKIMQTGEFVLSVNLTAMTIGSKNIKEMKGRKIRCFTLCMAFILGFTSGLAQESQEDVTGADGFELWVDSKEDVIKKLQEKGFTFKNTPTYRPGTFHFHDENNIAVINYSYVGYDCLAIFSILDGLLRQIVFITEPKSKELASRDLDKVKDIFARKYPALEHFKDEYGLDGYGYYDKRLRSIEIMLTETAPYYQVTIKYYDFIKEFVIATMRQ